MTKDPICGMDVDEETATANNLIIIKDDQTHYFCAQSCKDKFLGKEPVKEGPKEEEEPTKKTESQSITPNTKSTIMISGMHCASCVAKIENALQKVPGVSTANVNFAAEKAYVDYDNTQTTKEELEKSIEDTGYKVVKDVRGVDTHEVHQHAHDLEITDYKKRVTKSALFALPLLYLAMGHLVGLPELPISKQVNALIQLVLTTPIMWFGRDFFINGFRSVVKTKSANMDTLIALGTGTAYVYSIIITILLLFGNIPANSGLYFEVAGLLIVFILLGKWLEAVAKGRTGDAIKKLMGLQPKTALVTRNGKQIEVPIEEVQVGDNIVIKPGQKIPVDGIIVEGRSTVDESMITGESMPTQKIRGDEVIGATINKTGSFVYKATKVGKDTALAQIIKLVENAQGSKAPIQRLADKISAWFVPAVMGIAILTFIIWLLAGQSVAFALTAFIAVIIIACPCALGLATPTAVMVGTGIGAQNGILIKNAHALQKLQEVTTIIFDKTGTLTRGEPEVTDIIQIGKERQNILSLAAIAEKRSEHPLADAIMNKAKQHKIDVPDPSAFNAIEGRGVEARHRGMSITIGNKSLMEKHNISMEHLVKAEQLEQQGKTVVFVATDNHLAGMIAIADTVKPGADSAVRALKKMNKEIILVTGDNKKTARGIADQVGIARVIAEVLPGEKADIVKDLQSQGKIVGMVGDGINDAPALAQADMGIAIGSGTDVAVETGDIVLIREDLKDVVRAIELSKYSMMKIKQNLFWAFIYNGVGIPIAAGVLYPFTGWLLNPIIAGAAMAASSVSVVTNSLLMKRFKPKR
jgi:P-type Cu+ transporter